MAAAAAAGGAGEDKFVLWNFFAVLAVKHRVCGGRAGGGHFKGEGWFRSDDGGNLAFSDGSEASANHLKASLFLLPCHSFSFRLTVLLNK